MEYIRLHRAQPTYNPNTRHVVHGLDADLIMLALATHEPHFTIVREMITFGKSDRCIACGQLGHTADACTVGPAGEADRNTKDGSFQLLQINVLREYLELEFEVGVDWSQFPGGFDLERAIDDFIFICFLAGNDFLPPLPSLHVRDGGIDTLIDIYKKVVPKMSGFLTSSGDVRLRRAQQFIWELGAIEDKMMNFQR